MNKLNINDLIEEFLLFYKNNKENIIIENTEDNNNFNFGNIDNKIYNEFELSLFNIPVSILSNLSYYKELNNHIIYDTYFELKMTKDINKIKYRIYIPMIEASNSYDITNSKISINKNYIWNEKKLITIQDIKLNNIKIGDIKHSTESKCKLPSNEILLDRINIIFTRKIEYKKKYFKCILRLEASLGSASLNKPILLDYLKNPNTTKNHSCRLEIEYIYNEYIYNYDLMKKELYELCQMIFGYKDLNIFRYIPVEYNTFNLKTFVEYPKEILSSPLDNISITPKVDGKFIIFNLENDKLYLYINNILLILNCNIDSNYSCFGAGELVYENNIKIIYPFYIKNLTNNNINILTTKKRLQCLKEFFNILNNNIIFKDKNYVLFKEKPFITNFNNYKELLINIKLLLEKPYTFIIDGLIIFNPDTNIDNNIIDYKLKLDNTVDVYSIIDISKGILLNNKIEINLYYKNIDNNFILLKKTYLDINKDCTFDTDIHMLKIKDNNYYKLIPHQFISEYSFIEDKIIKIRYDKTNYIYLNNKNIYGGNNTNVIEKSKLMHETNNVLNLQNLRNIITKLDELPDDKTILDELFNINNPQIFYNKYQEKQIRTPLNILSNFSKTNLITLHLSPLINNKIYKSVLSIDAGKGGDANKYFYMGIKKLIATDVDEDALNKYSEKHAELNKRNKSKMFKFNKIVISIIDDKFKSSIDKINNYEKFDIIDYQLAIHFYWENSKIPIILNNLSYFSQRGTKLLITTNNGDKIKKLLENNDSLSFLVDSKLNIYFNIYKLSNNKIKCIYLPSTSELGVEENLVFSNSLISKLGDIKYELNDKFNFDSSLNLTESFKLMYNYYNRTSTQNLYKNLLENIEQEINNKDLKILLSLFTAYSFIRE